VYRRNQVEMQPHDPVILMLLFSGLFWGDMVESAALGLWQAASLATALGTNEAKKHC